MKLVLAAATIAATCLVMAAAALPDYSSDVLPKPLPSHEISIAEAEAAFPDAVKGDRLFAIREDAPAALSDAQAMLVDGVTDPDDSADAVEAPPPEMTTAEFCAALADAAKSVDIPVPFFARLIWQESRFKSREVSHVGAQGVAQFMPATAAEVGLDDPFDARKALPASARFLRKLHDQFGNLGLAAAAYNAGPGRIQNWLARRGPLPDETRHYVRKITGSAAEQWTSVRKVAALHLDLPREAPCEGFGGLSRDKEVASMPVALTPVMAEIIRKAEAAAAAARIAAAKAKARIALLRGKRKGATLVASADSSDKESSAGTASAKKTMVIAIKPKATAVKVAALARRKTSDAKRIKVASAAR